MPITKLEELNVMFVSGVKYPATNKNFFLVKEAQWEGWVAELRQTQPALATKIDDLLAQKEWDEVRKQIAAVNPAVVPQLDKLLLAQKQELIDAQEPAEKDFGPIIGDGIPWIVLYKRKWTVEMREQHKKEGGAFAGPDMSFPIANCEDVKAAYMAAGRAKGDSDQIRENVIRIAKEKKLTDCLPETAQAELAKGNTMTEKELAEKKKKKVEGSAAEEAAETPTDEQDEGDMPEEEEMPVRKPKKANKGILGSIIESAARGAGYEIVPAGTLEAMKHIGIVIGAIRTGKSLIGEDDYTDDVPAGAPFGLIDQWDSVPAEAPVDDLHGGPVSRPWLNKSQMPDVAYGTPATENSGTVTEGEPFPGSVNEEGVVEGVPVTKSEFEELLKSLSDFAVAVKEEHEKSVANDTAVAEALNGVKAQLTDLGERMSRIETVKGLSKAKPAENIPARKSEGAWAGSAFDFNV